MTYGAYHNSAKATSRVDFLRVERAAKALGLIGTIRSVQVNGARQMAAEAVMTIADLKEGAVYNPQDVSRQIGALKSTGFFSEVEIEDDGGHLEITVSENPAIRNVVYEGVHLSAFKTFERQLFSVPKSILSRNKVIADISFIHEELDKSGVYDVEVIPKLVSLENGKVDLIYQEELRDTLVDDISVNDKYARPDNINLQFVESLSERQNSFLEDQIADAVSGPLSRALRLAKFPESERNVFIEDTISRIVEHRTTSLTTPDKKSATQRAEGMPLPDTAPEIYQGLRGPETPPQFVKRIYEPWLGHGLTRAHIRKLDPTLYTAMENWSRRNQWPSDVDLPKLKEQNTRWADRVKREGLGAVLAGSEPSATLREADRLRSIIQRRQSKDR